MSTITQNSVVYTISGGSVSVTGFSSPPTPWNLVIPSSITDTSITYNVTSIGTLSFQSCSQLVSIIIPNSIITMGTGVFFGCTNLVSVTLGSGITSINYQTFIFCTSLSSVFIPTTVTTIVTEAFNNCIALTSINIPSSVTIIEVNVFIGCTTLTTVNFAGTLIPSISSGNFGISGDTAYCVYNVVMDANFYELSTTFFTNVVVAYPCFKEGSKILTNKGYIPIEDLIKGDLVKTLKNDFVPINMIGNKEIYHPAIKDRIVDQLYKCSSTEYPEIFEDLVLTGAHSILVDCFKDEPQYKKTLDVLDGKIYFTDDKTRLPACVDERASVYGISGNYKIYHLALEHDDYYMNYGIYANGLLVETSSKRYLKELSGMDFIE